MAVELVRSKFGCRRHLQFAVCSLLSANELFATAAAANNKEFASRLSNNSLGFLIPTSERMNE